mgnify:CR=1 FL=1
MILGINSLQFYHLIQVYEGLLLSPGKHTSIHVQRINKKRENDSVRRKGVAYKRRRQELKNQHK